MSLFLKSTFWGGLGLAATMGLSIAHSATRTPSSGSGQTVWTNHWFKPLSGSMSTGLMAGGACQLTTVVLSDQSVQFTANGKSRTKFISSWPTAENFPVDKRTGKALDIGTVTMLSPVHATSVAFDGQSTEVGEILTVSFKNENGEIRPIGYTLTRETSADKRLDREMPPCRGLVQAE